MLVWAAIAAACIAVVALTVAIVTGDDGAPATRDGSGQTTDSNSPDGEPSTGELLPGSNHIPR